MTFIPYQVDHTNQNVSKTLGFSKKRVSFKFGLASPVSLAEGKTGAQCRGSEHEVVFVWSLKSGKRWLYLDGKEIHFSESGMNGWTVDRAWQHAFPLRDSTGNGTTFKMHFVSQPVNKEIPDSRPFDLRMNGTSYFAFNEIWKLGTSSMTVRDSPSRGGRSPRDRRYGSERGDPDAHLSHEERRQIAAAKLESLRDIAEQKAHAASTSSGGGATSGNASAGGGMKREEESLISFDDDPVPPPQIQNQQQMERARSTSSGGLGGGSGYFPGPPSMSNVSSMTIDPNDFGYQQQQQQQQQQYPYTQHTPPPLASYGSGGMPGPYPPPTPPNPFGGVAPAVPVSAPAPAGSMFDPMASGASQSSSTAMTPYVYPSPQQQQQAPPPQPMYGGGYGQPPPQQAYTPNSSSVGGGGVGGLPPQFGSPGGQSMHSYASYGSAPSFAQPPSGPPQQQQPYYTSPGGGPGGGGYGQAPGQGYPPPPPPGQAGYPPQPPPGQGYPPQQQQPYY